MKRQRGRSRNNSHNKSQNNNRALESNGPGVKVRGAASTIYEKYQQLARDASLSGDRVMAENYLQFAEHYYRVMHVQQVQREAREEEQAAQRAARQAQYDARKTQQQQQQQERQTSTEASAQAQPAEAAPATQPAKEVAPAAPVPTQRSANGTGPLDIVLPAAIPEAPASPAPETTAAKPARTPRRRVRRPAAEAKTKDKPADMGDESSV